MTKKNDVRLVRRKLRQQVKESAIVLQRMMLIEEEEKKKQQDEKEYALPSHYETKKKVVTNCEVTMTSLV